MAFEHLPVMLEECIEALNIDESKIYVDGTAGGGGHAFAIAQKLKAGGHLYALDQDPAAIEAAGARLKGLPASLMQANFENAAELLKQKNVNTVAGVLLDLGVSSHQLDTLERGFSYKGDAPLDMRMSQSGSTAADILNSSSRQQIADILRNYGEEPYAWQIAGKVLEMRQAKPLETTGEFLQLINAALPSQVRRKNKNPGKRAFQAIRIAVNAELDVLESALDSLFNILGPGGRMVVLTFHSLEDRIVKNKFKQWATACTCPPGFPLCVCGGKARGRLVTKKPITACQQEQEENRRSRPAKLRVIEKL